MTTAESISTGIERLYTSAPEPLPFDRRLVIRSFLLRRDPGNLPVYGSGTLERDADTVRGLGGISRQYRTTVMRRCSPTIGRRARSARSWL
jgi:hypothetical protein